MERFDDFILGAIKRLRKYWQPNEDKLYKLLAAVMNN